MTANQKTEKTRKSILRTATAIACLTAVMNVSAPGQDTEQPVQSIFSAYVDITFDSDLAMVITANKSTDMSSSDLFYQAAVDPDIEVNLHLGMFDTNGDLYVSPVDALAIRKEVDKCSPLLAKVGVWDDTDIVHVVILPDWNAQTYSLLVLNMEDLGGQEGEEIISAHLLPLPLPTSALETLYRFGVRAGFGRTFKASDHIDSPELWDWVEGVVVHGRYDDADIVHMFRDNALPVIEYAITSLPVGGDVVLAARP